MRLLLLALALGLPARADTVYLKNGNQMDGIITEQTKTRITLDIGYGSTILDRADIEKIVRSNKNQASKTAVKLKRRQYESGLTVPKGGERLDGLYRDAQARREKALDARRQSRELDEEFAQLQESLPDLKAEYGSASTDLGRGDAGSNPRDYNRRIGAVNSAGVKIQAAQLRLGEIERLNKEAGITVHGYIESHRRLADYVGGAGAPLLKQEADYYAWLRDELTMMAADFRQDEIPTEKSHSGLFVKVRLNGKVDARMLVDTGASISLLYQETVAKLGLPAEAIVLGAVGRAEPQKR
ncbi:MAG: retropepsin-like aspartic protease, partial [Elusimicrobiota bacterium]